MLPRLTASNQKRTSALRSDSGSEVCQGLTSHIIIILKVVLVFEEEGKLVKIETWDYVLKASAVKC